MVLVKDNKLVSADSWHYLNESNPELVDSTVIDLEYWLENKALLAKGSHKLGLMVDGDVDFELLSSHLSSFDLICINFPVFTDGRGYSLATLIRASGYQGELRACGDVLADQVFYLSRVGFTAFEFKDLASAEFSIKKLAEFSVVSQPSNDSRKAINQLL